MKAKNKLSLKFGTPKTFDYTNSIEGTALLDELDNQNPTPRRTIEIVHRLIDLCDTKRIYIHWRDKYMTKEQAKQYVSELMDNRTLLSD